MKADAFAISCATAVEGTDGVTGVAAEAAPVAIRAANTEGIV